MKFLRTVLLPLLLCGIILTVGFCSPTLFSAVVSDHKGQTERVAIAGQENPLYLENTAEVSLPPWDAIGDDRGAWHSADLLYAFSTLDYSWRPFEAVDREISYRLSAALCAFAACGDPNCSAVPHWAPGAKRPMRFCEQTRPAPWTTAHNFKQTFAGLGWE